MDQSGPAAYRDHGIIVDHRQRRGSPAALLQARDSIAETFLKHGRRPVVGRRLFLHRFNAVGNELHARFARDAKNAREGGRRTIKTARPPNFPLRTDLTASYESSAGHLVAQASEPAVSQVSKPASR